MSTTENDAVRPVFRWTDADLEGFGLARLVEFEIPGGVATPEAFAEAVRTAPAGLFAPPGRGVILSGRGPVWAYGMMLHAAHPTPWIATADPRLGAVIVQSHTPGIQAGQLIPIPLVEGLLKVIKP